MIGQLFTQDFLSAGIRDTPAWQSITVAELGDFESRIKVIYAQFKACTNLNEPVTTHGSLALTRQLNSRIRFLMPSHPYTMRHWILAIRRMTASYRFRKLEFGRRLSD